MPVALAVLLLRCGGLTEEASRGTDAHQTGGTGAGPSDAEAEVGPEASVYDAQQEPPEAAPDVDAADCLIPDGPGKFSCCDGSLCKGYCTVYGCDCGGIDGGCWDGTVCCLFGGACSTPEICEAL